VEPMWSRVLADSGSSATISALLSPAKMGGPAAQVRRLPPICCALPDLRLCLTRRVAGR
jgi:hypothetical protein